MAWLIIRGKLVNEKVTRESMLKEKDWLKGSFWIVFDSAQCELNLHKEQRIQDRHCLHASLLTPFSSQNLGLKARPRIKSAPEN